MRHALIMAGGSGTRLWPLSRRARPKQLLRLFEGRSLLQLCRARLQGLFRPERIWVITSAAYVDRVAAELPDIPPENLIAEPVGRDTANAIGLAAYLLSQRDADGTMAVFSADHLIESQDAFAAAVQSGLDAAERFPESLVTFGIRPHSPHTGYGYVRRGQAVADGVYRAAEFKEKPTPALAETYLRSGEHYWNCGMFAWRLSAIRAELERCLPENAAVLAPLAGSWRTAAASPESARRFESLRPISIDFAVLEPARDVLVVEMRCRWTDVGSWTALASGAAPDAAGNAALGAVTLVVDGSNNTLVSERDHLIVVSGLSDLIVVHSPDATLICRRDQEQKVRELAALRRQRFGERYE